MYFESHLFSVLCLKSHRFFWSCSFVEANKSTSPATRIFVRQFWSLSPGQIPILLFFCQRGRSSFKAIWRTVLKSKLDSGSPCLVPFFISNMSLSSSVITVAFGFLYSLFKRLMYSCSIPQVLRTSQIELGVMESNAIMECFRESTSLSPSACLSTGKLFLNFRWTCVVLLDIPLLAPFCVPRTCLWTILRHSMWEPTGRPVATCTRWFPQGATLLWPLILAGFFRMLEDWFGTKVRKKCSCVVSRSAKVKDMVRWVWSVLRCDTKDALQSWAVQVHGDQCVTGTLTRRLRNKCATTVHEKMWCAVGVSTPPVDCQEISFPASEMTSLNKEETQLLFSPGWCLPRIPASIWLPVAALLPVRWRRWMRRPGGRVDSPSCTKFKSVIVFFEAFNLLIKPLPDLLCKRDCFASFSNDFSMFVIQSFAFVLRFYKVTALIHWCLNTFSLSVGMLWGFESECILDMLSA